jgi:hypothetical protein
MVTALKKLGRRSKGYHPGLARNGDVYYKGNIHLYLLSYKRKVLEL